MDKNVFTNSQKLKDFDELFGWRIAPHVGKILLACEKENIIAVSEPRQNFKTEAACVFLFNGAIKGESGLFTAHNGDIVREALRRFSSVCRPLIEKGIVERVNDSHGFQQISFKNGAQVYFRIRTSGVGVGLTVDRIVFDEAQKMSGEFLEDVMPTLTHSNVRKMLFLGTPPTDEDFKKFPSSTFHEFKRSGSLGKNFIEYSSAKQYEESLPTTLAAAKRANPAWEFMKDFGKLIKQERATLTHEQFCRQRLGVWKFPTTEVIHEPYWKASDLTPFFTERGSRASMFIAGIGILPKSNRVYVSMNDGKTIEVAKEFSIEDGELDEVVKWLFANGRSIRAITIPANQRGRAIDSLLRDNRMKKTKMSSMPETSASLTRFINQLTNSDIKIYSNPEVKNALGNFWLSFDDRSGSTFVSSASEEDAALVLSLLLSTSINFNRASDSSIEKTEEKTREKYNGSDF